MSILHDAIFRRCKLYLGVSFAFGVIAFLSFSKGMPILITPLAASTCILFSVPNSRFARPKNVVFGHIISSAIGVAAWHLFGMNWFVSACSVALAVAAMDVTDTMHPPAAATSLIAVTTAQGFDFILKPVALGAGLLVLVAELVKFSFNDARSPGQEDPKSSDD